MLGKRSYRGRTGRRFPAAGLRRVELLPHCERGHDLVRKVAGGTPPSVTCHRGSPPPPPPPPRSGELAALTHLGARPLAIAVSGRNWSVWRGRTLDKGPPPPRSPTALAFFPPIFFFFSFAFLLRSHRIARGHIGIYGNFYRTRDFYTRRKKHGGFSPLTRVRQLLSEECGRRRAGTALEGRVSERERPGRRKARED